MYKIVPLIILLLVSFAGSTNITNTEPETTPETKIGERLFLETRFARASRYKRASQEKATRFTLLANGKKLSGAFRGQSINCRSCHMVDEHKNSPLAGIRTYSDYARLSPVPDRNNKKKRTLRNSQMMINITIKGDKHVLLHHDGQFSTLPDLVVATLTGENFGWNANEYSEAVKHIAEIIRNDNGKDKLAKEFGGSYKKILLGTSKSIPNDLRLPAKYRIDVTKATDEQILKRVSRLIGAYVSDLKFSQKNGAYNASPYDKFLSLNNLPAKPHKNESDREYSQRLFAAIQELAKPVFVTTKHGKFESHKQAFEFGPSQLEGLKLFMTKGVNNKRSGGNCISCHSAPHFTDFSFHNTGLTQINYDKLHGVNKFASLAIPSLAKRKLAHNIYLPKTNKNPDSKQIFRSALNNNNPLHVDLGLWNTFANPDMPAPQKKIRKLLCTQAKQLKLTNCNDSTLLSLAIASFKTPTLRDLGHSNPYMHSGQFDTLKQSVNLYIQVGALIKTNKIRNAAPQLKHINLSASDSAAIVSFLKSLNEDYE